MALDLRKLSILVVEDVAPMRELIAAILDSLDVGTVFTAETAERGFQIFCKHSPDIVITDWNMKPMNGIEFTKLLRTSALSPNRRVPVVLVTGYAASQRVATARDAGITEFLAKPFSANDLAKRIIHIINKPRDFLETPQYIGPDRRRAIGPHYPGPFRRDSDPKDQDS